MLALVAIYGAVQIAALRLFGASWSWAQRAIPIVALISLTATLISNLVPVPTGIAAASPLVVIAWLVAGFDVVRRTP